MGCVYQVKNKINGMSYIGKTINSFTYRKRKHQEEASRDSRYYFHRALKKYGFNNFEWEILFNSDIDSILCEKERHFIESLETMRPQGYNLTEGGDGISGYKFSEAVRKKLSIIRKGKKVSQEVRAKISATKKGIPNKGHKGHPISEETRAKISKALKGQTHKGNKNYRPTEETKKKISKALKGHRGNKSKEEEMADPIVSREDIKCDACGKDLTMKKGCNVIMQSLSAVSEKDDPENVAFMKAFMGPYDVDRIYNICGECVLRAYGVKPETK